MPEKPFSSISMDFVTALPESSDKKYDALLTIVDRLTKFCILLPCHSTITGLETARLLHSQIFNRYGFPEVIVSDRDPRFTSAFYTEWCRILRIRQNLSTAFHPETDGQSERFNRTLQQVLRCYCSVEQNTWTDVLPAVEFAINAAPNETTSVSPFMALFGFVPSSPFDLELKTHSFRSPLTQNFHAQQYAALQLAKKFYEKAQQRSKAYADKNRTEITFKVDDIVLLATKNLKRKGSSKLLMPYCGPFRVTKVVSHLAYQLDLPGRWRIHDVFHVSLLKPFKPRGSSQQYIPLPQLVEGEEEHEIESIVDHRIKEYRTACTDNAIQRSEGVA